MWNQRPDMYITPPLKFLEEKIVQFPNLFGKTILEPWINASTQIVSQLSRIEV